VIELAKKVAFQQVDVFTAVPFKGNPVAVILDGNGISKDSMHGIAHWTNLSETTFICAPADPLADYTLRIFTPMSELPFAGHPTIGSAHAYLANGGRPKTPGRLVQECGSGLVTLYIEGDRIFLTLPKPMLHAIPPEKISALADALGIAGSSVGVAATVDVGVVWMTLQLKSADQVRLLKPDMAKVKAQTPHGIAGVTVFGLEQAGCERQVETRSFAPAEGVAEDPVCGSGNGCVAALIKEGRLLKTKGYVAGQGCCVGRDGRVEVRYKDDGAILLGGNAVTCIQGTILV
jgi:PhzF family phenazine biosynthesis protein